MIGATAAASEASDRPTGRAHDHKGASCNTPPLNTEKTLIPQCNQIVIDWFEFTLPDEFRCLESYKRLKKYIDIEGASFRPADRGLHGYKKQILYGKVRILMDGNADMGVHVILSGEAIRQMRADIRSLLEWVLHNGGTVTRIDLALDDVTGSLTLSRVKRAVRSGAVSCRAKEYRQMKKGKLSTGEVTGETFYFGSAQSRTQYRIYDKAAERGIDGHWVRCEGQYRNENAHKVAQMINDESLNVGRVYCGLLRGFLNFLIPSSTDTNKARWKTAVWWLDLLDNAEKLKLSVTKPEPSLERSAAWIRKQVAPTIATLLDGYGVPWMEKTYLEGKRRMTPEQRELSAIPF